MGSYATLGTGLGDFIRGVANSDAIKQAAYNAQMRQNLRDALLHGKVGDMMASDQAWSAMPQDLNQLTGGNNGQAYTDVTRATGSKVGQLGDFMRRLVQTGDLKGAVAAGSRGDTQAQNVLLSAGGAKPVDMTKVSDNTAFNPNVLPEAQKLHVTPYGHEDLANKFILGREKATGVKNIVPLNSGYLRAFYTQSAPTMENSHPSPVFETDKFNGFTTWAADNKMNDLNAAYPQWLRAVKAANANTDVTLGHARAAIQGGIHPPVVQRRLQQLQVDPAVVAKLQQAPSSALAYLKAHPELAPEFKSKYGYLPQ